MLQNSDIASRLQKIGFAEKESLVYGALVLAGGAYPSRIAEETKLNRTTVYKILLDLSVKGLVSEIRKKNKLYYQVENPDRLRRYVKSRVTQASADVERAEKLLPDFESLYAAFTDKPTVTYYEGSAGVISLYEDMMTEKKYEMLAFSNASEFERNMPDRFFMEFLRKKERLGITTRGIIPDTEADRTYVERNFSGFKPEIRPQIRLVPREAFPFKGEITVYGTNKVAIVNLNKEYLTGIIIQDATIHNMLRMIFELAWKGAGK